jgi:hypothetical protein
MNDQETGSSISTVCPLARVTSILYCIRACGRAPVNILTASPSNVPFELFTGCYF